ncbi:hypothetical protein JI664_21515 [Rhodobacter sp. NTK016B]|uniref:hypothetical protein n=1 Tax=Rhodobacter sp. NTK016B TaxID=2759676 RepID=UPI001A904E77|nr:hypothetical protein [Rhodobacter sp. NTK016B]MBN8294566.1 hypothetical protein [Rhodobacter sp. NTK016B]
MNAISINVQQKEMRHPIVIMIENDAPAIADLMDVFETSPSEGALFASCLTVGYPFIAHATPNSPAYVVFSLKHRDAPLFMHRRAIMDTAFEAFCTVHSLPFLSADELLVSILERPNADTEIVNWLSSFNTAYDQLED